MLLFPEPRRISYAGAGERPAMRRFWVHLYRFAVRRPLLATFLAAFLFWGALVAALWGGSYLIRHAPAGEITMAAVAPLAMPPAEFDHYPTRPFRIMPMPSRQLNAACYRKGRTVYACVGARGVIKIDDRLRGAARARVLRHEFGHLNGWVHE